ncbi:MAG: ribonuclease III [Candidatus Magasanikbacteria bacterium CG10_big_fil_rev_8_21_14_0_10_47_10]|uniref:Ribonuclease 3 n=1 Tax=Candidatus Magasanikbacteria bacterium CG10_big_fil_rev_8_21_14_0_10_47_10 TaxID=1974652 RepID=A0A2H0TQT8_9BACT|nr:MAG: ribonuclease III [Candidatus Magasanikbacteria bacterium CG10_big_fil_rev_8_21_14_0_10_47_10]
MRAEKYFQQIESKLGVAFNDKAVLLHALTHRSFINEDRDWREFGHYDRMELLGDAVLELTLVEFLFRNRPDYTEGRITGLMSDLRSGKFFAEITAALGLMNYVRMGNGQREDVKRQTGYNKMAADVFEAVVGAIYLDQGMDAARTFFLPFAEHKLLEIEKQGTSDYKSQLQELSQAQRLGTPQYKLQCVDGPDNDRTYTVAVIIGGYFYAVGVAKSSKDAEKLAAKSALPLFKAFFEQDE